MFLGDFFCIFFCFLISLQSSQSMFSCNWLILYVWFFLKGLIVFFYLMYAIQKAKLGILFYLCTSQLKMWHHVNCMEILHWNTSIRVSQEGAIKDLGFLTLGQWQFQNTIFFHTLVFCLFSCKTKDKWRIQK